MLVNSAAMRPSIDNVSFLKFQTAEKQCTVTVSNVPTSVSQLSPYGNNPTANTNSSYFIWTSFMNLHFDTVQFPFNAAAALYKQKSKGAKKISEGI